MAIRNCFYIECTGDSPLPLTVKHPFDYSQDQVNWTTPSAPFGLILYPGDKYFFKGTSTPSFEEDYTADWFGIDMGSGDPDCAISIGGSVQSLLWDGDGDNLDAKKSATEDEYYTFKGIFSSYADFAIDVSNLVFKSNFTAADGHVVSYYFADAFNQNAGIKTVPNEMLPSTTLAPYCYANMFTGCFSLTSVNADLLPATTPVAGCYYQMFSSCTKLKVAPIIHLTRLTAQDGCYAMFKGCSKLNEITADFKSWGDSETTLGWVGRVSISGTFYAQPGLPNIQDADHVPEGWNVIYAPEPIIPPKTLQLDGRFYASFI